MSDDIPPLDERSPRVTLKDVARRLGISHVSVSVALRDRVGVSEELKKRIKETAAEMGYVPEPMARALAVYRHNKRHVHVHSALAWLNFWPDSKKLRSYPEFNFYWKGALDAAMAAGFHLEEFTLEGGVSMARLEGILRARGIRGLMIPPHATPIDWAGFSFKDFAIVKLGHSQVAPQTYVVAPDQVGNALLAYDQIRAAGYSRIGYVGNLESVKKWWFSGAVFMEQVLESPEQRVPPLLLKHFHPGIGGFEHKETISPLQKWYTKYKPEVILCETGDLKISMEKLGVKVPGDVAMVNLSVTQGALIDSGINQNPILIGKAASDTLIDLINRNAWGEVLHCHTVTVMGSWESGSTLPVR